MQCSHCGTELHPSASLCWRCGKVPAKGIEPPLDARLAPSEQILLFSIDSEMFKSGSGFFLLDREMFTDTAIVTMFIDALLECQREDVLRLDLKKNSRESNLLVSAGGKRPSWQWQTLETRMALIAPQIEDRSLRALVSDLVPNVLRMPDVLFEWTIEALRERGLVMPVDIPGKLLRWQLPINQIRFIATEAGHALARKYASNVTSKPVNNSGDLSLVIEQVITSALDEARSSD